VDEAEEDKTSRTRRVGKEVKGNRKEERKRKREGRGGRVGLDTREVEKRRPPTSSWILLLGLKLAWGGSGREEGRGGV
jgi:hypothetical protein